VLVASLDRPVRLRPLYHRMPTSVVVVATYFLISIFGFWPVLSGISRQRFSYDVQDFTLAVWGVGWVPHALAHGLNPFFSESIFVPTGVNLAQNVAAPFLGLIAAPVTLAFGPLVAADVLMVLAMPLSATAAFVVLRKWQVWPPAAALGGLIYGFSPYMVGQGVGHPALLFLPLPPFIALTVVNILQRRGSPGRLGIQLGLLVAAQYLISQEVLATVAILTITAVVCVAIRYRAGLREMIRAASRPFGIALVVAMVLLAYPIGMMIAGPQHATGTTFPTNNRYHNDLLSFVLAGPLQKVSMGMGSSPGLGAINATEAGSYIGIPLLILVGFFAWKSRRSPRMQLAVALLLGTGLFSLGPHLAVGGRLTHIPLPFIVVDHVPLLDNLLPSRLSFELGSCVAAVVAFGLDDMRRRPARTRVHSTDGQRRVRARSAVVATVTLAVLVATQLPRWPYETIPAQGAPAALNRAIPEGNPIAITYPYDTAATPWPMLWQAEAGFSFRLLGGYAYHPGPSGGGTVLPNLMSPRGLQQFLSGQEGVKLYGPPLPVSPDLVATARATLTKYHVRLVIVDRSTRGSGPVIELFNDAIGPARFTSGQFSLWSDWPNPSHR
jgi:hypothetical protein